MKPNLLDILTSLLAQQKIQRGVKYPLSYLVKEISKDFENGVPRQLTEHTAWVRITINGEPGFKFAGIVKKLPAQKSSYAA